MSKQEKVFPKGMITKEGNVDFVKARISIKVDEFIEDIKSKQKNGWVNLDILQGNKGFYACYNTFEPKKAEGKAFQSEPSRVSEPADDGLPF